MDDVTVIHQPMLIIEKSGDGKYQYRVFLTEEDPRSYGIILSDLADHITKAICQFTGRDPRDVREGLLKVMRDEDRFKSKDPSRGGLTGSIDFGRKN